MAAPAMTRREAIRMGVIGAGALVLAGCGDHRSDASGSTLHATWRDLVGDGQLRLGPGEPLVDRLDLADRTATGAVLATLVHVTDAHVLDASSPARVTFLDRLGSPLQSTFRPQEALTVQVLAGIMEAVRGLRPQLIVQGGDLIDNDQHNELAQALATLRGGRVKPGSGPHGYYGVQSATDADPFYYRPDVDSPRFPGLLRSATNELVSRGAGVRWYPVLGDHDALVAGEIVPTDTTRALAVGGRALWGLPPGLTLPAGLSAAAASSPDGPPDPGVVDRFLQQALTGPTVEVPPDPARKELSFNEVLSRLRGASGAGGSGGSRLDYSVDAGPGLRLVVLDLARRDGGSGGQVSPGQKDWLADQIARAGKRWLIVISHQPLTTSSGGPGLLELLDRSPRVLAALSGHTHRNRIESRHTKAGGYWLISTASLIDFPQQARALRVLDTAEGGVALQTWMLDHTLSGPLGTIARQLSFIDAQGGRPGGFAGGRLDRNVTLYRRSA